MNATRDDDALNWAGDDDPTLAPGGNGRAAPNATSLPEGWTIPHQTVSAHPPAPTGQTTDAGTTEPDTTEPDTTEPDGAALSSVALVGMGILAGMYLLYTIGWFIGVARTAVPVSDPVAEFMFSLGAWLAVAAPPVWFGVTCWLTKGHQRARLAWLLIGVVVLAPLPFIIGSGAGS
jgi:hypothetical protein